MRQEAKYYLAILRKANEKDVYIRIEVQAIIAECLHITDAEFTEIGELLKADIREMNANYSAFGEINDLLK